MFEKFVGAKVLITGHTGFKGSWLTKWLQLLGAEVIGIGLSPPSKPALYSVLGLGNSVTDYRIDIRDSTKVSEIIIESKPDYVFHLAAQSLVRQAYIDPVTTYETNVIGTLNILEALRMYDTDCCAVLVTSDKSYRNQEWPWGYRETDLLGGSDPYSGSKGAAEFVIQSYSQSLMGENSKVRIGVGRAGNVVGGGDWAKDRIIPDCVRSWAQKDSMGLRNPHATRPWQHVLEPLSGYLTLAVSLSDQQELHGEAFNFGPHDLENYTVDVLVEHMAKHWEEVLWHHVPDAPNSPHESELLKLSCEKAFADLDWRAVLSFEETVKFTADWYRSYYEGMLEMGEFTEQQIRDYSNLASDRDLKWTA